jgi:hypothetical protein
VGETDRQRSEQACGGRGQQADGFRIRIKPGEVEKRHPTLLPEQAEEVGARHVLLLEQDLAQPAPAVRCESESKLEVARGHESRLDDQRAERLGAREQLRERCEQALRSTEQLKTGPKSGSELERGRTVCESESAHRMTRRRDSTVV